MDIGTYLYVQLDWERVERIFFMMDIRQALTTREDARKALEYIQRDDLVKDPIELKKAQRIRNAVLHPQTNEVIFLPLRLSMVIPVNMVLDALMLNAVGPWQTIGAQWLNQSYNACHYYANRNTTNHESIDVRIQAYLAATGSSVGVALWLERLGRLSARVLISRVAPWAAVATADVFNIAIMRKSEYIHGVQVYLPSDGSLVGVSQRAGLLAVGSCIVARVAAATPVLLGTPLVMHAIHRNTKFFQTYPSMRTPTLLCVIGFMIQCAVPLCFGLFHQDMVVPTKYLEPRFIDKAEKVKFNKGL